MFRIQKKYKHTIPGITPQTFGKHGDLCHSRSGTAATELNCQLPCDVDPSICRPIKGLTDILTTRYSNSLTLNCVTSHSIKKTVRCRT